MDDHHAHPLADNGDETPDDEDRHQDAHDSAPIDDDEDNMMRHRRPLDIGLALDGEMDSQETDETADVWVGLESARDAAEQGDGLEDDGEHPETPGSAQGEPDRVWLVLMAERDEDGQWCLVGGPVEDARFDSMGTAHLYAENRSKRDFGKGFDWLADPPRAWLVIPENGLRSRVLRLNRPMPHGEQLPRLRCAPRDANQFC